jgi:para-aminobenzoate synthetase component 1
MLPRTFVSFTIPENRRIKLQMLNWASRFNICAFLDNQHYQLPFNSFECLLAAGAVNSLQASAGHALDDLRQFAARHNDWIFGHFAYDLVHETESFGSPRKETNPIGFPDLFFFIPEVILELKGNVLSIGSFHGDGASILEQIVNSPDTFEMPMPPGPILQPAFTREDYLATIGKLRQHILRGDCYEINFCQEFFSQPASIDPLRTWSALSQASPNPFSAYYKLDEKYLLCASPERYLRREGNTLISQPIKGTAPRAHNDPAADEAAGAGLKDSAKDRSENVMVVDLVRNDLSKICLPGTVRVEELFGVYSFPQVYQMVSTIKGEMPPAIGLTEAIKATFPMGSMTGAPKKRVVELIDRYERTARGLFSGALGYVTPHGDFDFNVVIRSLFYNEATRYLSYQVGSGITFYSDPEQEYEECLVKAEGIKKALQGQTRTAPL